MPNAGYATLQVIPSVRGISEELRRQLVGPAADAGERAGAEAGGGLRDKLKAGAAAAGLAAGALLVKGITDAVDQANIKSTLQAQLGTSNKVAAQQGKVAGKLYSTGVSDSFQGAADAIKAVVSAGLAPPDATNKQLQAIATKASDVANVFGQDLGGVTNAVSQMMRTGLAKNSSQAFDILTKGFQSGADKGEDLLDTINEYGTQFRKAGLDGQTAMGLISQAIKGGARDSDIAADAIKEFSLRVVDVANPDIQAGFKGLGLSAKTMGAEFGRGGKSATAALDTTLDRLRGVKDPVKQASIATALFGTQAEDLGAALFKMDPSSAAKSLGSFSGAAGKLGKTIRSGPAYELQIFQRSLQQGFVDFLGGEVLPVITQVGQFLNAYLVPALAALVGVGAGVVRWLREWGVWLAPLAVLIVGVTLALNAQAIATGLVAAVFAVYRAAILAGTAVTQGFAAAQALLNSVMALNPITLIVIALVALGAALVVAYNKSETFRAIVTAAWNGIKVAALFVWNSVLKPALQGIWVAMQAVGRVALWLWGNAIGPAFKFIWTAAKVLFAIVATAVLLPLIVIFKLVATVAKWLWNNAIGPAFRAIGAIFKWLWNTIVKPYFAGIVASFKLLAAVAKWLYANVIRPVFTQIKNAVVIWWAVTKGIFIQARNFLRNTLGPVFMWLWKNVIRPVWNGIKGVISSVWNTGIKPVFNVLKIAVGAVGRAFQSAVRFISKVWDGLKAVARRPVQFVVDTVYNHGIRAVWNTVAGLVGLHKLAPVKFADGGRTRGGTPGKDSIPSLLMADEYVVKRDSARSVGFGALEYINRTGTLPGFAAGGRVMPVQRFAEGGIVGWLTGAAKKIGGAVISGVDFLTSPGKMWNKATGFIREKISTLGGTDWVRAIAQFPVKMLKALKDSIVNAAKGLFSVGSAKGSVAAALAFAKSQAGKPYQWGGVGNPSWDCSGFMGGIQSVILGQSPRRRLWSTFSFQGSRAPSGWKRNLRSPFRIGITNQGVGHTAGTLAGVNVESRGGDGVVVGRRARGWNSPLFTSHYGFAPALKFDAGGQVPPGYHAVYNGTRRPEPVLTDRQWNAVFEAARRGQGGGDTYNFYPRTLDMTVRDLDTLQRRQEARARVGRPR